MSGRLRVILAMAAVAGAIILAGAILLPTLNRAREVPGSRITCEQNLREIAAALQAYADAHGGAYPPDFPTLLTEVDDLSVYTMISPGTTQPYEPGLTTEKLTARLNERGRLDYIYCAEGLTTAVPDDAILVCEPAADHDGDGTHVLLRSGRTVLVAPDDAKRIEAQAIGKVRPVRIGASAN